jgi:hypothetical protein
MAFLAPDAPLILLLDGTLERRWGRRIAYKGRFHDAVRSQTAHVKSIIMSLFPICFGRDIQ